MRHLFREMGRKERESLQKLAEIAKEGFLLKQQLIQEAKRGLEEKKVKSFTNVVKSLFWGKYYILSFQEKLTTVFVNRPNCPKFKRVKRIWKQRSIF